jgi:hypothetical protein
LKKLLDSTTQDLGAKDTIFQVQIGALQKKKKKKTTIIEILVGEGSGIAPSVVSSVGCGY